MLAKSISGAAAAASPVFVEDTFSSYLYTGNGSTQTITNGIDLSGKGGLVWAKKRGAVDDHALFDTERGDRVLSSNFTDAQTPDGTRITYQATGFQWDGGGGSYNQNTSTYVSWTFRKQAKFFDVVTYTGDGIAGRTVSHNLGSVPGCIIVKRTDTTGAWQVYHRSLANTQYLSLNTTAAAATGATRWNSTTPTSTVFSLGTFADVNASGGTYVAYLFAHDAGGFGLTGADNVITCGSYTGNGSATGPTITLGYEPQWLLIKRASGGTANWILEDNMRSLSVAGAPAFLYPNTSDAETTNGFTTPAVTINATGFQITNASLDHNNSGNTYIYIAIRRGPMKVPTSGTSVHTSVVTAALGVYSTGFPVDFVMSSTNKSSGGFNYVGDRLRGGGVYLTSQSTSAETSYAGWKFDNNTGVNQQQDNRSSVHWNFRRAPGFFDVVCYTGTGANRTVNHNLAAVPELMIVKRRNPAGSWETYVSALGNTGLIRLQTTDGNLGPTTTIWNNTTPTSTVFSVGTSTSVNGSGDTYIAYLFASASGVSKVGSYTGNGTSQTINCGFTGGARFVLIKRTDSTGDWYVWDSARGIVAGNDPYLLLNSTAAEVTNTDYIDTYSAGFEISSTAPAAINANGGTFIFLAIA